MELHGQSAFSDESRAINTNTSLFTSIPSLLWYPHLLHLAITT
jgi:hypothetical protein